MVYKLNSSKKIIIFRMFNSLNMRSRIIRSRLNKIFTIIAPNENTKKVLTRGGISEKIIRIIPYGVEQNYHRTSRSFDLIKKQMTIGFIGTLSEHKGLHILIKSFKLIKNNNVVLHIWGNLNLNKKYAKTVKELASNDQRITFKGTFPPDQISTVLDEIDILVVPSIWQENTPLIIQQAKMSGCPIIHSDQPGMDGVGVKFKPGDPEDLALKLDRYINSPDDLNIKMKKFPKPDSFKEYVDKVEGIYSEAIISAK